LKYKYNGLLAFSQDNIVLQYILWCTQWADQGHLDPAQNLASREFWTPFNVWFKKLLSSQSEDTGLPIFPIYRSAKSTSKAYENPRKNNRS